jgi:hypothetical protein
LSVDIPNAFVQTDVPPTDNDGDRITMKIAGPPVEMLVELDTEIYVIFERKTPILYFHVIKAHYGMLQSALLFYKKLIKGLSSSGFKTKPHDPCVCWMALNIVSYLILTSTIFVSSLFQFQLTDRVFQFQLTSFN